MASKPINPQPLQMPNLSQLPDPMKDLMGGIGLTNPVSMMTMNQQGIDDLFAPKPIDGNFIKPSAEAAKALQTAQQQAQAQTDEVAKLQQQQLEIIEKQKREAERQARENMKLAERMRKEREKALKKKKEQQGGKLGAAPDGSFVLAREAKALIAHPDWKAIVSDMQRNDQMNNWLKEAGDALHKQGIAEDVIKAELEHAKKIISDDTRQYVKGMREDRTDLHDLGLSVVKGLAPISNLIGAGVGALGFDNAASTLHQFGTDLSNAMDEAKSKTMQLDKANNDYLNQKSAELNPNRGWFERAGDSLANIHKSGNKFSTAVDLVGVAIPALVTGGGTALATQGAGRATIAYAGRFAQGSLANRGLTFAGNQIAKHGAPVTTVAAFGGGDAAQSAWDGVMNASFDNIKSGYIRAYGETDWNALVKEHNGDEEAIKRDIANNSAEKAVAAFVPMAILAAPLGLESMVARTVAGKSNAVAGSKLLAIGAAGISEGIEEGLTTFAGNYGQHGGGTLGAGSSITGTTLDAGVPEAAAIGVVAGVGMSAPMTMYGAAQAKRNNFSVKNIDVNSYVTDGNLNQQLFEQEVLRAFYAEKRSALNQGMSEAQANAYLQLQFNQYIDNEHTWNAMHPDMHAEFKKKMETEFDISSNNYAMYQDTAVAKAFASGDINQVKALNDEHALNAFRMARGVETDLVPKDGQVYYQALADVMTHLENSDKNVNTKGRHAQYVSHTNSENSSFQQFKEKLSREDLASIDQYVMTVLDAGQRRLTNQQQEQYNAAQQAAQIVQQQQAQATTTQNNPQGTNNGTNQQTNQNQSAGQGTATQNAGPVPSQSGGVGGTDQQTANNQTQVGADNAGGATANPTQSGGDGLAGQGTNTSPTTDPADQNRADPDGNRQGAGQTPNTGNTVNSTTPTNVGGQATQQGITGQADQNGQPIGQIRPSTTQATTGSRSVGATPTERSTDDRSNQAPTKASIEKSLFENGAEISDADIQSIVNDLPSNLKKSLAYAELRDNITIPSDKALSDYSVAQALAALPNEQFNKTFVPALGAKSMRTGRGKTIRNTYIAIIKGYAQLIYDRQLAQYRSEQDARRQAEREQNAQARAEEQARIQQERAEQKAETDRIKAEQKAQREAEKEQTRLDRQAERERQAQEKAQAREQKKIDDADIANTKAQQVLRDKQEILREKELVHTELTDSRAELVSQLNEAKLIQKESKETVREYEKLVKKANTAVDKADKAWRKELEKSKRKELKEQWTVDKNAATTIKNELTKAIKALEVAGKAVNDLNKKIEALDDKIKKAKQAVTSANREVVSARTIADKTQAKLDALRGIQADEQLTADTNADNGSQDVGETDIVDIRERQVEQELNPNLPAIADQPQRNKRMRIEMTSTGRPTILMGMESTGLPTIEMGYTIYLDYIPEQHKAEVRQDLMSDIPNDADIVGIIRELADIVGVTYDTMLDKLVTNADNLNQNEYDRLASLLDTILIDLYGETNEQTNTSSNSESSEIAGETQRSEQGTARQTQRNAEPTTLPAVLGFRSLEAASRELTPLINTPVTDLTLADFTALVDTISQATNLPADVVVENLAESRLLLEAPQGDILDFVYDEIKNVWVWASEYNSLQRGQLNATQQAKIGYEQTPSREQGNRSLNAPNRAGTPALAEPTERVQEPIRLGTTETGLGTIELGNNTNSQPLSDYITDESGNPVTLYHARNSANTEFDPLLGTEFGIHFGDKLAADDRVNGIADNRIYAANLRISNPIRLIDPDELGYGKWGVDTVAAGLNRAGIETDRNQLRDDFHEFVYDRNETDISDYGNKLWNEFVINYISDLGYDGVVYKNVTEGTGSDSYIVFNKKQIELLDNDANPTQDTAGEAKPTQEVVKPDTSQASVLKGQLADVNKSLMEFGYRLDNAGFLIDRNGNDTGIQVSIYRNVGEMKYTPNGRVQTGWIKKPSIDIYFTLPESHPSYDPYTQGDIIYSITASHRQISAGGASQRFVQDKTFDDPTHRVSKLKSFLKQLGFDTKKLTSKTKAKLQEQSNATQDDLGQSVQPTQERTTDENTADTVGNTETTNDGQGEILGQSGQLVSKQSQESGTETTQDTEQLGVTEPLLGSVTDKQIITSYANARLTTEEKNAIGTGKASVPKIKEMLTTPQANLTDVQISALNKLADHIRLGKGKPKTAPTDSQAKQTASKQSVDVIADVLDSNPELVEKAEQALEKMGLDVSVEEFVRDVLSADYTSREVEAVLNNPSKYKKQLGKQTKPSDIADEIDYEKAKKEYDAIRSGSQRGAIDPEFLFALPTALFNAVRAVWNAIKNNFAKVSLAVAISTGSTFTVPTEANAATPTETAVVQNIVSQNDNQGKQFIVADKQAGTLTLYTPQGQEITSTPALFGKAVGDSTKTNNATPSGRFDLTFVDGKNVDGKGYGSSAQALSVNGRLQENNAGNVAIHRVLPIENRQAKLDSATATDNRISHGCINVPSSFYDIHLDRQQDTVVYVIPETDTGRSGVFNTPAVDKTTPVANVAKEMDTANGQSVEVSAEQITNATPHSEIKQSPVVASAPAKIAGTTPSGQIANVTPTVIGGVTITQIDVPFKVATPAEMQANGVFDTDPISGKERTDDGLSAYDVVLGILGAYGAGAIAVGVGKRRKKLASKQAKSDKSGDITPPNDVSSGSMSDEQAQEVVDTNHNQQAKANKQTNGMNHVPTNVQAPPQKTALADAISREMWVNYMNTQSHNARFTKNGQVTFLDDLTENLDLLGYTYDVVMSDPTYEQINNGTLNDGRKWKFTDPTNRKRAGISATMMNFMAGVTQNFDNLMHKHGIARGGHEADSSLPSIHLAQVRAKASGAYAQIHKLFVKPLFRKIDNLAVELRTGIIGLEADIGRVSTLRHILNEGADALWRSKETLIAERQTQLAEVQAELARTSSGQQYSKMLTDIANMLKKEITQLQDTLDNARDMYEGRKTWDGKTKLPGGYTKARAEQDLADIKAKYGSDFSKVENLAKETAQTVLHIRQFATASGVFSNADLDAFNEIGFKEYVPLYREQKDNRIPDETDNETQTSIMDRLTADIPTQQAKAMGLTKDLSRYAREGSTEIAADGITNLKLFSMNMAGRIGQQQWLQSVQQLYEGNVGKPFSQIASMSEQELADLNTSADSGKLPGLVRVRPGMEEFLPSELRAAVKDGNVKPIIAKGFNKGGNLVTYHYYFTEPTIQNEVYDTTDLTDTHNNNLLRNVGTITRTAARMMTTFKPVWNVYNYVRDSFERTSIMLMRPVKDRNGNLVNRWDLSKAYFKNLAAISSSLPAQQEIYRYLTLGEVKTKLQRDLHEAVGSGAINLMTSQTEKHSVMADIKKSGAEKLTKEAMKMLGAGMNKVGAGKAKQLMEQGLDMYIMRLTEVPQITTAMASYLAYKDVGVNQTETANRVRDQYDPLRAGNKHLNNMSTLYPFVRSTFSGHYNLHRSLTEYWGAGEWQFTALYAIGATLGAIGLFAVMSGLMGDDEDGVPKMARLPTSTLMAGIPIPIGDDGVWSMPVGFGMNKLFLGVGANIYKQWNGWQEGSDTAKNMLGLVMDNTSPVQMSSSKAFDENPVAAVGLSFVPTVLKPIVELGFNVNSFHGGKIINQDTPRAQYDHLQDNFNVPEDYKNMVTWLHKMSGGAVDMRPETLKYLFDGYGNMTGPFSAIPKAILQDKGEKTMGNAMTKGEHFNPFLVAIGADMAIQPNALNITSHTYAMQDLRYELHKQYGVGETHSKEDYARTADTGPRGGSHKLKAWELTKLKLEEQNAPQEVIDYIVNGMKYNTARKEANSAFKDLADEYYKAKVNGTDTAQMRIALQDAWDNLENLTNEYVMENNRAYYELRK